MFQFDCLYLIYYWQPENTRRQRSSKPGIARTHGLSELLPFPRRQPNCHQLGRYDLVFTLFLCFLLNLIIK